MRAINIIILICILLFYQTAITGQSVKLSKEEKRQERKNIDSLLLVHSIPVKISAKDSLFRIDIQILLRDSIKAREFEYINHDDASTLYKKYIEDLFGINNKQRMLDNIENVKKDKEYFIKEVEYAQPLVQSIEISACMDSPRNCIIVQRYNFPNAKKKKSWEFKSEQSESINQFVSRIIDSLTGKSLTK